MPTMAGPVRSVRLFSALLLLALVACSQATSPSDAEPSLVPPDPAWDRVPPSSEFEAIYREWAKNGLPEEISWTELNDLLVADRAQQFKDLHGVPAPSDVSFERFAEASEWPDLTVRCIAEYGFLARVGEDGGVLPEPVPEDQRLALEEALYRCDVRYPLHPRYLLPPTVVQVRINYDYILEDLLPCLEEEGYHLPDPPTWPTFLETYNTADNWHPSDFVEFQSPSEQARINLKCPWLPPWSDVYGEPTE